MPDSKSNRVSMKGQLGRGADAFFGGEDAEQDTSKSERSQSSMPVIQSTVLPEIQQENKPSLQENAISIQQEDVVPVKQQDGKVEKGSAKKKKTEDTTRKLTSKPVKQEGALTLEGFAERFAEQYTGKEVEKYTKGTYYITPEQELKIERFRLKLRSRGLRVDKSAIMRDLIDLIPEE